MIKVLVENQSKNAVTFNLPDLNLKFVYLRSGEGPLMFMSLIGEVEVLQEWRGSKANEVLASLQSQDFDYKPKTAGQLIFAAEQKKKKWPKELHTWLSSLDPSESIEEVCASCPYGSWLLRMGVILGFRLRPFLPVLRSAARRAVLDYAQAPRSSKLIGDIAREVYKDKKNVNIRAAQTVFALEDCERHELIEDAVDVITLVVETSSYVGHSKKEEERRIAKELKEILAEMSDDN